MGFESKSNLPKPPVQTHSVSSEKSHIPSSSEHGTSQSAFEQELEKIKKYGELATRLENALGRAENLCTELDTKMANAANTNIKVAVDKTEIDAIKEIQDSAVTNIKSGVSSIGQQAKNLKDLCEESGSAIIETVKDKVKTDICQPIITDLSADIEGLKDDYSKAKEPVKETIKDFKEWIQSWHWKWYVWLVGVTTLLLCSLALNGYQYTLHERPYNEGYDDGYTKGLIEGRDVAADKLDEARKEGFKEGKEDAEERIKNSKIEAERYYPILKEFMFDNRGLFESWSKRKIQKSKNI